LSSLTSRGTSLFFIMMNSSTSQAVFHCQSKWMSIVYFCYLWFI
jgi:hypothetical protein